MSDQMTPGEKSYLVEHKVRMEINELFQFITAKVWRAFWLFLLGMLFGMTLLEVFRLIIHRY